MAIDFAIKELFSSDVQEKVSVHMRKDMAEFIDELAKLKGFNDRSKTVRWCIEQVAKEAIAQGIIKPAQDKAG